MKKLLVVLFVLAVCVVAIGFYRGWFALSSSNVDDGSNKVNVNLTVDKDKMQEDAGAVKKKSVELTDNVTSGEKSPDDRATDNAKSND
jgi:hypothetical protein